MYQYMKRDNWLYNYRTIDGVDRALCGLSSRIKRENKLDDARIDLINNYDELRFEFDKFIKNINI